MNNNIIAIGTALKWCGVFDIEKKYYQDNIVLDTGCIFRCKVLQTQGRAPVQTINGNGHFKFINQDIWDVILDMSMYYNKMADIDYNVVKTQESVDMAEQAVTDASKMATASSDYATASASAASASATSAEEAAMSAEEAENNAHSASMMANNAQNAANEATISATTAQDYASAAVTHASNAQNAANEAVKSMNAASASATSASESAASASASKEEVANAITEHQAEMETFSEQCKYRYVTLNFGANEETMQLANINGPALVLETVIMSNVERVYMTTSSMVKEDITGYTASSSSTSKIIEAYSFATFDIVRSGSGTASVGLKFKVQ